ncbi:hypothetical protein [Paenibacillus elgii]|uniref:hypothetical protein n=1 Tax=Paenibacillus elgii TaxID=189691 RepID=UPI0009ED365D|nr:hypothetical protein [Paenibacillus elgii]
MPFHSGRTRSRSTAAKGVTSRELHGASSWKRMNGPLFNRGASGRSAGGKAFRQIKGKISLQRDKFRQNITKDILLKERLLCKNQGKLAKKGVVL